jgi:hypothetical protein
MAGCCLGRTTSLYNPLWIDSEPGRAVVVTLSANRASLNGNHRHTRFQPVDAMCARLPLTLAFQPQDLSGLSVEGPTDDCDIRDQVSRRH